MSKLTSNFPKSFSSAGLALIGLLLFLISCNTNNPFTRRDYRDGVIGNYEGFLVKTQWRDTSYWSHDSIPISVELLKGTGDSIITCKSSYNTFDFKYTSQYNFIINGYHAPTLTVSNNHLRLHHQPGLGPYWVEIYADKVD